jgi:hypothetical protein
LKKKKERLTQEAKTKDHHLSPPLEGQEQILTSKKFATLLMLCLNKKDPMPLIIHILIIWRMATICLFGRMIILTAIVVRI